MKNQPKERLFSRKELLFIVFIFSIYAISLLSVDPEWVLWAGSMSLGSLYIPDQPPRLFDDPREALQMASAFCLIGLVALLCLMVITGEAKSAWLSWLKARWIEWRSQQALGDGELPKIGLGAHPRRIDSRSEK